jgi:hypothetical protein
VHRDLNLLKARPPQQLGHLAAEPRVGAGPGEAQREQLAHPVPFGKRRVAQGMLDVRFLAGDPAARPGQPGHLRDDLAGRGDGDQQGARVHQVEPAAGQAGAPRVPGEHRHASQPRLGGELPGRRDVHRVGVQADDPAGRADRRGEQVEYPARAAPEVDRRLARPKPGPAEQRLGLRPQFCGLPPQPGGLLFVGAERVVARGVVPHGKGVVPHGRMVRAPASRWFTGDLPLTYHAIRHPRSTRSDR